VVTFCNSFRIYVNPTWAHYYDLFTGLLWHPQGTTSGHTAALLRSGIVVQYEGNSILAGAVGTGGRSWDNGDENGADGAKGKRGGSTSRLIGTSSSR
jgi:hypothetical protein